MTQTEINSAIQSALNYLSNLNEQVCDYWISELYSENMESINTVMWNEDTLKKMELDVMYNS